MNIHDKVVNDYPVKIDQLELAIGHFETMFTKDLWDDHETLSETFVVFRQSLIEFHSLKIDLQSRMITIRDTVKRIDVNLLPNDDNKLKVYNTMIKIFSELHMEHEDNPDLATTAESIIYAYGSLADIKLVADEEEKPPKVEEADPGKDFIKDFCNRCINTYLDQIIFHDTPALFGIPKEMILEIIRDMVPYMVERLTNREPRVLNQTDKDIISVLIRQFSKFLEDLHAVYTALEQKGFNFNQMNYNDEATLLAIELVKLINRRGEDVVVPIDLNVDVMRKKMLEKIKKMVRLYEVKFNKEGREEGKKQEIVDTLKAMGILPIVCYLFSPKLMCLAVDRLVESKLISTLMKGEFPDGPGINVTDREFSTKIGKQVCGLFEGMVNIGQPRGAFKKFSGIIKSTVKSSKDPIGVNAQKLLNMMLTRETLVTPMVVIDELLFKPDGQGSKMPSLLDGIPKEDKEWERRQKDLEVKMKDQMYKFLIPQLPKMGKIVAQNMGSFKDFCNVLTKRLYRISQQDLILKILFSYLIDGINEVLEKKG